MSEPKEHRMLLADTLEVLARLRTDQIVVATMGAARQWPRHSQHELDLQYLPSAMGQAPALALGLALAEPRREVIALNGDGCMLMNLGALVTIVASGARNLTLVVFENGLYEVTGGQPTAGGRLVDFAGMARAAGFNTVAMFDRLESWQAEAAEFLRLPGPRFVTLRVEPVGADYALPAVEPIPARLARFQSALRASAKAATSVASAASS